MSKDWTVYGWMGYRLESPPAPNGSRQTREVCYAPSVAVILRATGMTRRDYNHGGSETGVYEEMALAKSQPGTVFWRPLDSRGDWNPAEKIAT